MTKRAGTVLGVGLVLAVVLVMSGCSMSTSSADIRVDNYASGAANCDVDGTTYSVSSGSTRTIGLEWDGLSDKSYTVDVYNSSGTYQFSESFTLSDGDTGVLEIYNAY